MNIFILHQNPKSFSKYRKKLLSDFNQIKLIELYKFKIEEISLPSTEGYHLTQATYFRLFLENFIPKNIEDIIYLDGDVYANNDLGVILNEEISNFKNSGNPVGAKNVNHFNKMKKNYFNAGVMFINTNKWTKVGVIEKFKEIVSKQERFKNWDQDILNLLFPKFYILPEQLNAELNLKGLTKIQIKNMIDNNYLIHYSGKNKPWSTKGFILNGSKPFFKLVKLDFYNLTFIILNLKKIINSILKEN